MTGETLNSDISYTPTGLRNIEIPLADEFGLNKKIKIRSVHIYLDEGNQKIEISYYFIWSFENIEVKREIHDFKLDNKNPNKPYLDIWDKTTVPVETELGALIAAGIVSWFS